MLFFTDDVKAPNHTKLTLMNRHCLIRLDHVEKGDSAPPPLNLSSPSGSPSSLCLKRRRLGDLRLLAWQVAQQAVLEVVPVSLNQIPPGTRVCAAWSNSLANYLYPGVTVERECLINLIRNKIA